MNPVKPPEKLFRLIPDYNHEKYDGKTVEFLCDSCGTLLLLTGRFVVHVGPKYESVDIHYSGRLDPLDPPHANYVFHVSNADLRSAFPARKPGSQANFLLDRLLWSSECRQFDNEEAQQSAS